MNSNGSSERRFNLGFFVFVTLSILSLVAFIALGLVPIYILYGLVWGLMAWLWEKKNLTGPKATVLVLVLAMVQAFGAGYRFGQDRNQKGPWLHRPAPLTVSDEAGQGKGSENPVDKVLERYETPAAIPQARQVVPPEQRPYVLVVFNWRGDVPQPGGGYVSAKELKVIAAGLQNATTERLNKLCPEIDFGEDKRIRPQYVFWESPFQDVINIHKKREAERRHESPPEEEENVRVIRLDPQSGHPRKTLLHGFYSTADFSTEEAAICNSIREDLGIAK